MKYLYKQLIYKKEYRKEKLSKASSMSKYYIHKNKNKFRKKGYSNTIIVLFLITLLIIPLSESTFQKIQNNVFSEDIQIIKTFVYEKTSKPDLLPVADGVIIEPNSSQSPIRKYFTTKKIIWTFDDYKIEADYYPPHKGFGGLSQQIGAYGGYVGINCIFMPKWIGEKYGNEIRNYSAVPEFSNYTSKFLPAHINVSLEFFNQSYIEAECHGWNHSEYLNNASLSFAYTIVNYSLWNWYNNYHIKPHLWLGHHTDGNYNVSVALKKFSERYWTVYAEDFNVDDPKRFPNHSEPAVEYIGNFFDPYFGCNFGRPCKNLTVAQQNFTAYALGKEVVGVRGHPYFLNGTDQRATENLTKWQQFIDWVYQNHTLININHTEAIEYKIDRENFTVEKNTQENYTINLTRCMFDHNILFTNPNGFSQRNWTLYDQTGKYIGIVREDVFLRLKHGMNYFLSIEPEPNTPPNTPSNPSPTDTATNVLLNTQLNWTSGDPDGNTITYDIYFGTTTSPSKVKNNQSNLSYAPGTLTYNTIYYWKIVAWDSYNASAEGPLWHFKTASQSGNGGGGSGDSTPPEPQNKKPIANASAGKPYQGFVNSAILFNGSRSSDPDGNITKWFWIFDDATNGIGKTVTHTYSKVGTYNVTLTVTDNKGATNADITTCTIIQPNRPPTKPIITGPINGTTNTSYDFTAISTDADNDTIRYSFIWGDITSYINGSKFLPSNTSFTCSHRWTTPGQYNITVTATDNHTEATTQFTITIEAEQKDIQQTPGFDAVFLLCAIAMTLLLWKKKQKNNGK